jgi:hypothetical protein
MNTLIKTKRIKKAESGRRHAHAATLARKWTGTPRPHKIPTSDGFGRTEVRKRCPPGFLTKKVMNIQGQPIPVSANELRRTSHAVIHDL